MGSAKRRIGVHTSIAGGLPRGLVRARDLGCTTVQIFSHNPRGWAVRTLPREEASEFRRVREELDIHPVYVHASYLINIASPSEELRRKSVGLLSREMQRADALGADYVVLHTGSAGDGRGPSRAVESIRDALGRRGFHSGLLIENTSGKRGDIASRVEDLSRIMEGAEGNVAGVCLDTCHAFAAGYDFRTKKGLEYFAEEIEKFVGTDAVKLLHLNDSRGLPGSGLDRHEHIGMGRIGADALGRLLCHPVFSRLPVILETPKKSEADDTLNLRRTKQIMGMG